MDLLIQKNFISLACQLLDIKKRTQPVLPDTCHKPKFETVEREESYFKLVNPESEGVDSKLINDYLSEIYNDKTVFAHTVIVLKNGKAIAKKAFAPYNLNNLHVTYSLCKSITSLAIGILVDKKMLSLDENVYDIFKGEMPLLSNLFHSKLTVKHLLTMTSGSFVNETVTHVEANWKKAFLESSRKFDAGERFDYNSINSYILCCIISQKTGKSVCEFLNENLFCHMDISNYYWEKSPEGIEKGGFGMYMLPEDMAKIGLLYLQKGLWKNKQLISANWFKKSCYPWVSVPRDISNYDYGYHVWVKDNGKIIALNGMLGQNVLVIPESNVVVAITAGNGDLFHDNSFFAITEKYFCNSGDYCSKTNKLQRSKKDMLNVFRQYFEKKSYIRTFESLVCKKYDFDKSKTGGISILPMVLQVIQNNYCDGVEYISFEKNNNDYICKIYQGGNYYCFPLFSDEYYYCDYSFNDETYACAVKARCAYNEDNVFVIVVDIHFTETACVRCIKLYFDKNGCLKMSMSETPANYLLYKGVKIVEGIIQNIRIPEIVKQKYDADIVNYAVKFCLEPEADAIVKEND